MNDLAPTEYLDYPSDSIQSFIQPLKLIQDKRKRAVALYYKVRDSFIYDPYHLDLRPAALIASKIINNKRAWCVEKAIIMASCARALDIPARLGYGIVVNHIGVEKLTSYLKRPEIVFHGYVELQLNNKWVKVTPAFDRLVCKLSKVPPLEWDGFNDAMFQEFVSGNKFMEYIHFYGSFDDVPIDLMNAEMKKYYPHLFEEIYNTKAFSFHHLWSREER